MADNTYSFSDALEFMKQSKDVSRTEWGDRRIRVRLLGNSKVFRNLIMKLNAFNDGSAESWMPSMEDLLAEDWFISCSSFTTTDMQPLPR